MIALPAYINIHTHHASLDDALSILNVSERFDSASRDVNCSMGLHPWYLKQELLEAQLSSLANYVAQPNVLAIGECGLDKVTDTSWDLQLLAFEQQIQLANKHNKPLIIHCVRAYEEVLQLLSAAHVPVIFHGFNKSPQVAERILKQGYYISFGKHLLTEGSNAAQVLSTISTDRYFLETDNANISIQSVYEKAAAIKQIPVDDLILQFQKNYKDVFIL